MPNAYVAIENLTLRALTIHHFFQKRAAAIVKARKGL
jgi:hypothetical protein